MMAHNLCYSTLLAKDDVGLYRPEDVEKTPGEDYCFVRASKAKGVLPLILEELLAARKRAKQDMAKATDPFIIAVQVSHVIRGAWGSTPLGQIPT